VSAAPAERGAMPVFRAPMRSRSASIPDDGAAVERALVHGVVGLGDRVDGNSAGQRERLARRIDRFAQAPDGAFVVTMDARGSVWLGRLAGPYRRDDRADAHRVDLVHVRPCQWGEHPLSDDALPAAIVQSFARGGRNWQQITDPEAAHAAAARWGGAEQP
jgi:hypothetical protein